MGAQPGSPVAAVIFGVAAAAGGEIVVRFMLGIFLAVSGKEVFAAVYRISSSPWGFAASVVTACAFSLLGGYICARVAKRSEYKVSAATAVICAATAVLMARNNDPLIDGALGIATFGAVMLGAWLGARGARARSAPGPRP